MQKGSAALILLLVGLIIVGLVGAFYFGLFKSSSSTMKSFTSVIQKPVYRNQSLGFEFQYGKDLTAKQDSEEEFNKRGNGDFRKNFTGYVGYEPGKFVGAIVVLDKNNSFDANPLAIWVFNNDRNLTIEQWYRNYWYYPFVWGDFTYTGKFTLAPKDEATVSGQMGKSGIINYQPGKPKFIYISKDQKMYLFRIIEENGEKILDTFKFTSTTPNEPIIKEGCRIGGCSGELCTDIDAPQLSSVCGHTDKWYAMQACYKNSRCEKQVDGKCGWAETPELEACLRKHTP